MKQCLNRLLIGIIVIVALPILVGFSNNKKEKYTITYQNSEEIIDCITNEDGILLLPLHDVIDFLGCKFEECGRCGKDEIYNDNFHDEKGWVYVNWYKNIITYSTDPTVVELDAENEKYDGTTYTSAMLYRYIGFTIVVDETNKSILVTDGTEETGNVSSESSAFDLSENMVFPAMVYVYNPDCSSCKAVTHLLNEIEDKYDIDLIRLDASDTANSEEIKNYASMTKVPQVIRDIYPILYVREQYLFNAEITIENIEKIWNGETILHNIEYSEGVVEQDTPAESQFGDKVFIYFYSTTCAACKITMHYIDTMKAKYPEVDMVGYNLYIPENILLLREYGKKYHVASNNIGEVPAVFISDHALIGDKEILEELEILIEEYDSSKPTPILELSKIQRDEIILHGFAVFTAGLFNGINPCSLSMFLFLMSLIMVDRKKILQIGLSFCCGKFIMFFLLGTVFYKLVSFLNVDMMNMITKYLFLVIIIAFSLLNLNDFIMAKKERYHKMILQLPPWLKGFNHRVMKISVKYIESKYFMIIIALLGMLLAFGEFMCTGQIYLTSIIVIIQESSMRWVEVLYLLLYSFAFILPLLIITLFVYYGKKVFSLSEKLLLRLPLIKVISSLLFIAFGLYVILR